MQHHPWYMFSDILRIFLEQKNNNNIPRIFSDHECIFLRVNATFNDAVNMIHDVITTANPFPYTAKFKFVGVRNNKTQQIKR